MSKASTQVRAVIVSVAYRISSKSFSSLMKVYVSVGRGSPSHRSVEDQVCRLRRDRQLGPASTRCWACPSRESHGSPLQCFTRRPSRERDVVAQHDLREPTSLGGRI
ncbi:hypothetical protein [Streptomyces sp. enrichment culture]|uniref:hypothetical protein n=1 Tax=Streptomyces sp. enrichment culture TaxID=1795815 RepID=UPI003F56903C